MNAEISRKVVSATEKYIKESNDGNVFWKSRSRDGIDSEFSGLQRFRDKLHMTLRAWSISIYSLHIPLLKFPKEWRRKHIQSYVAVCAYLPIKFDAVSKSSSNNHKTDGEEKIKT